MILDPNGIVFVGAIAGYGELTGKLITWNVTSQNSLETYTPIRNEGITSLASLADGLLLGGTTVQGGGGVTPMSTAAHIFVWNPGHRAVVRSIPIPGAVKVTDITVTRDNTAYFIAEGSSTNQLYKYDMSTQRTNPLQLVGNFPYVPIYNSLAIAPDGNLIGLASQGVFMIDIASEHVRMVRAPVDAPTFRSLMRHIGGILKSCSMSTVSGFLATEGIHGFITDPLVSRVRRQRF
jgi:hypothetical protein